MTTSEFIAGRDVDRQAVTRYINRHPEIFEGHTQKVGKEIDLDDTAIAALNEQYPLAKPVTVIQGVPEEEYIKLQAELTEAYKRLYTLSERLSEAQEQIAMAKATQLLLEDKEQRIEEQKEELADKDKELAELREQLQAERSKTWWQKLRGK